MDKKQPTTIDEYIRTFPKDVQFILKKIKQTISRCAPGSVEAFSYGIPTFDLDHKHLVHFAGFENHIGFYPTPSAIIAFKKKLSSYKTAKGSVQFPINNVPFSLINEMVLFRVNEIKKKQ